MLLARLFEIACETSQPTGIHVPDGADWQVHEVCKLINRCIQEDPLQRPTFAAIVDTWEEIAKGPGERLGQRKYYAVRLELLLLSTTTVVTPSFRLHGL
jgi:hypothetical protein